MSGVSRGTVEPLDLTVNAVDVRERSVILEPDSMSDDPRLEEAFALIRAAFADAGENAVKTFISSLQSHPTTKAGLAAARVTRHPEAEKSPRAPAGSARVLCKRALGNAGDAGLTIKKIQEQATGEYEKMLSTSAIRNELGVGTDMNPPLYKQVGGVWYLAAHAPASMRIVS